MAPGGGPCGSSSRYRFADDRERCSLEASLPEKTKLGELLVEAGLIDDLCAYDQRLRRLLKPSLWRLALAAGVTDRSPSFAMLALRLSSWVRTYATDVVTGGTLPFALDSKEAPGTTAAMMEACSSLQQRPAVQPAHVLDRRPAHRAGEAAVLHHPPPAEGRVPHRSDELVDAELSEWVHRGPVAG